MNGIQKHFEKLDEIFEEFIKLTPGMKKGK
jgi:hypothetical protein